MLLSIEPPAGGLPLNESFVTCLPALSNAKKPPNRRQGWSEGFARQAAGARARRLASFQPPSKTKLQRAMRGTDMDSLQSAEEH